MSDHPRDGLYVELEAERLRQDARWGEQNHPDGTGEAWAEYAERARAECDRNHHAGRGTWTDILVEELYEALAESDPVRLREELVQVAAVAMAWVEAIDRRRDAGPKPCTCTLACIPAGNTDGQVCRLR